WLDNLDGHCISFSVLLIKYFMQKKVLHG
ncbi:unnamed protein product, partial [Rotaria magnacalcarata]